MRKRVFWFPLQPAVLPQTSGVYFFRSKSKKILYVGKAANVRERIRSYITAKSGSKQFRLMHEARSLAVLQTGSDIEALVKESEAIKKHLPKYNVALKDDKRYFSICLVPPPVNRDFPRVWITHQTSRYPGAQCIGPFVDGAVLKRSLRLVRQSFPFCTCKAAHERMCLSAHLGLCPGYCCVKTMHADTAHIRGYARTLDSIKQIFMGQDKRLERSLKQQINRSARAQSYEDALRVKQQLDGLERIFSHQSVVEQNNSSDAFAPGIAWLKEKAGLRSMVRIETIDTSMIQGSHRVGVMTVFENSAFDPSQYRRFKIRNSAARDDLAMMREVLERRLAHGEWSYPDMLFVDGGKTQLMVARDVLRAKKLSIPVCALEKDRTHRLSSILIAQGKTIESCSRLKLSHEIQRLFVECSDRTHAYAIAYYRTLSRTVIR